MEILINKANNAYNSVCIYSYVKSRTLIKTAIGSSAVLSSFSSHAAGSTLGEMVNVAAEQAKVIPTKGPIFCWAGAFIIGSLSAWTMWKKNQEGASSQHSYGKGLVGFLIAAVLVSVGFMINTSANTIGADATTY